MSVTSSRCSVNVYCFYHYGSVSNSWEPCFFSQGVSCSPEGLAPRSPSLTLLLRLQLCQAGTREHHRCCVLAESRWSLSLGWAPCQSLSKHCSPPVWTPVW